MVMTYIELHHGLTVYHFYRQSIALMTRRL